MTNASFLYNNLWDGSGTLTYSSKHSNFPATQTRNRWFTKSWRSRYGSGSGWGRFVISTGVNDAIDFDEGGAEINATLTAGTYTADTLCTEIKTQLDAGGALTYTVDYDDANNKFVISATGNFTLRWNTGTNKTTSVASTIGYSDSADDNGGADSFTADNMRIHSEEWLKFDFGSAKSITSFAIRYHNLSSSATLKLQGHTADSWSSPDVDETISITDDVIFKFLSSAQSKRWWRIYINDVDNSDGYVELGRVFLGTYFAPTVNCRRDYSVDWVDPSTIMFSDGGQLSSNKKTKYGYESYVFEYITDTDLANFKTMWDSIGMTEDIFFVRDRDNASTTGMYCRVATPIRYKHFVRESFYTLNIDLEELR